MFEQVLIRIAADGVMIPIILLGGYALVFKVPNEKRVEVYSRIIVAGLTTYLLAKLFATVYQPYNQRPFELLSTSAGALFLNNPGFPSDHMLFSTAILCAVWFETRQKAITWTLAIMIAIVGIGRILALVHTPIDVVGGVVIALLGAIWYFNPRQ